MKKVLIASTALTLIGGMALADVTISGSGRFGLNFVDGTASGVANTIVDTRLRFNIDANKETDSGVTFGGRIRLQYDDSDAAVNNFLDAQNSAVGLAGEAGSELSAAKLYAKYEGMTLEAGNVDTGFDSAALMYNSEIGYTDFGAGDPQGSYASFSSGPYGIGEANRMGLAFAYSVDAFNARVSWIDFEQICKENFVPDGDTQVSANCSLLNSPFAEAEDEISISADYTFGDFTVSGAYAMAGNGIEDNDLFFLGAEYRFADVGAVGLLYNDNGDTGAFDTTETVGGVTTVTENDNGQQITLYGNYKFDAFTVKGFIANWDAEGLEEDTAFGLGLDYDIGGARLATGIQQGYSGDVAADMGVTFTF